MDNLTFTIELIKILIWPFTFLIALILIRYWTKGKSFNLIENFINRNHIKAKFGNAEFEFGEIKKLQENINKVAQEPDPKKRLKLAEEALSIEKALAELDEKDIKQLQQYKKEANLFVIAPYHTSMTKEELDQYSKFSKLGIIGGWSAYGGEEFSFFTPVGEQIVDSLNNKK
jgi:hypothetical protein